MSALRMEGLHAGFRAWGRSEHPVLHGMDLEVDAGERLGLVGPSGCGKTTAVRCALGLHPVRAGRLEVLGHDLSTAGRSGWRPLRADVQMLAQDPMAMLHPYVPIRVVVEDSLRVHRPELGAGERRAQARDLLGQMGLADRQEALPRDLSGGERRRAGLARVLCARPRLLLADEPTAGLDAHLRMELLELVSAAVGEACAIVWVSHDVAALAAVCDRIVCMHEGRVAASVDAGALREGTARVDHPGARAHLMASGWRPREDG